MCSRLSRVVLMVGTATLLMGWAVTSSALAKDDKYMARQHGHEHGYRDGYDHGREDRDRHGKYHLETKDYKEGDRGYNKHLGDKDEYKQGYRSGYKDGYDDAYYNRAAKFTEIYGRESVPESRGDRNVTIVEVRPGGYADFAYDQGYRDGIRSGQKDLSEHARFEPADQPSYRDGDHGYSRSYGDIEAYKRNYREGFMRGYQDGYGRWR